MTNTWWNSANGKVEIENETGVDGKLTQLKTKIEKTYPEAVPKSTPVSN